MVRNWSWGGEKLNISINPGQSRDARIVIWHANVNVEHAAFVRRTGGARECRAPLEDVGLVGGKGDCTKVLAREVGDLERWSAALVTVTGGNSLANKTLLWGAHLFAYALCGHLER